MPNLQDYKFDSNLVIQAIIMSPPGKGKTSLACTFPRPNFFDCDGKIEVARNPRFLAKYGSRWIQYEKFPEPTIANPKIVPTAYEKMCRYFDDWMSPAKRNSFDTWVLDSGTTFSMLARCQALHILGKLNRSKTLEKAQQFGMEAMEQSDWGAERSLVEKFVKQLLDTRKHVLLLVHQKEVTVNGVTEIMPLFTGDSKTVIPAMFKDVWHLRPTVVSNKPAMKLVAQPIGNYQIRSELGLDEIIDPDYDKIVARLRELQAQAIPPAPAASPTPAPVVGTPVAVSQGTTAPATP